MMEFLKKNRKTLLATAVILVCFVLSVFSIVLLENFSSEMQNQAQSRVELSAERVSTLIATNIDGYEAKAMMASELVKNKIETEQDFFEAVYRLPENEQLQDLKFALFFRDGEAYFYGDPYQGEHTDLLKLMGREDTYTTAPFYDNEYNMYMVGVYAPIHDCEYGDGIVLCFPLSVIYDIDLQYDAEMVSQVDMLVLCSDTAEIYKVYGGEGIYEHSNAVTVLRDMTGDAEAAASVSALISSQSTNIVGLSIDMVPYILAVENVTTQERPYSLVMLYQSELAYDEGYEFVNAILGTLIVFFLVLIGFAVYNIINNRRTEHQIASMGMVDPEFQCPTQLSFEKNAPMIIGRNKATSFAVIYAEINHYKFFQESLGETQVDELTKYVLMIFAKAMQIDELYARVGGGEFLLLLHYREEDNLVGRMKIMNTLLSKYSGLSKDRLYTPQLIFGIYMAGADSQETVKQMIEMANEARTLNKIKGENECYRFYSESIHQAKVEESGIELKMDAALANKEFRVFYQPKFNMNKGILDGAEALVRWYNPEKNIYNPPGVFMPLFEANGFVDKLDRYVYENVCQYLAESVANGEKVYPISVNVSRVTASKPDFLDYYIGIKNKYGIQNHLITIEFTESFAYEDYDYLKTIVDRLHKNGFQCSIDDFGVGFSSYNTLKQLNMDEIKLDMFFLKQGLNQKRDDQIIASVASLAKTLNMKVTQEGVETQDEMIRMHQNGVDVIQGYFYSKPLAMSDFLAFIDNGGKQINSNSGA